MKGMKLVHEQVSGCRYEVVVVGLQSACRPGTLAHHLRSSLAVPIAFRVIGAPFMRSSQMIGAHSPLLRPLEGIATPCSLMAV